MSWCQGPSHFHPNDKMLKFCFVKWLKSHRQIKLKPLKDTNDIRAAYIQHNSHSGATATISHKENHNKKQLVTSCCVTCTTQVPYKYFNHSYDHMGVISPTQQFDSPHLWAQALWKMFKRSWIIIVNKGTDVQILLMQASSRKGPRKASNLCTSLYSKSLTLGPAAGLGSSLPMAISGGCTLKPNAHTEYQNVCCAQQILYTTAESTSDDHTRTQSTKTQNGVLTLIIIGWRIYQLFSSQHRS